MFRPAKAALLLASAFISLAVSAGGSLAATYSFDNKRADVSFTYTVGFVQQSGRFTELNGLFKFDQRAPERGSISAVIKTSSLTANTFQEELRGSDFFNVAVFPEIRFVSRSVRAVGENSAEFSGDLTMNGVTQPVTLQVVFQPVAGSRPIVTATGRLRRSAFNMTALSLLVDDEIEIQIKAALQEKK